MIDFTNRLKSLKERRQGALERATLEKMALNEAMGLESLSLDDRKKERYEQLNKSDAIKYTIGAMSPVEPQATKVSIEEGERIANTLIDLLATDGINTTSRMQGSVPLDIHIKGHSDVDMLILIDNVVQYENPCAPGVSYIPAKDPRTMVDIVKELREKCEEKLTRRYPAVDVDCQNAKSIAMSGGSLRRKVDIVPSNWFDNIDYQRTKDETERQVRIYNKKEHKLLGNSPFKHIKLVNQKDAIYKGNLKKCVRLLKNLVADMPDYKKVKAKKLSSFDIVGICYNMDSLLNVSKYTPLALVDATLTQLGRLRYIQEARDIRVPDNSRKVFDNEEKVSALEVIHEEILSLAEALYKDINGPSVDRYKAEPLREMQIAF